MDYVENLLQSIDQIVHHRLRDQKFDETIICTVTDTSKASRGLYVVSDGTIKFDAYSELTDYKVDEAVRVNIPKGDYSQKKYIIGRSVSEKNGNQPIVYNSPSAEILDISGNLCTNSEAKIIANGGVKEVLIWSNERLSEDYANSIYDSILISAQFQTFFSPYNISKGTYGLRLKVIIAPKKASDKIICREYDLDSRDMFGDPYNYLLPSLQEAKFNFNVNENIQQMSLYLYQNDDFIYKNDTGTEQQFGMTLAENIHVSNVHIGLGTNLSTIEDSAVKIYTDDDLTYNSINGTNQKAIKLIWYNKDDKNRYVGFSDGVVDNTYDEMDYDKKTNNHNRLMVQASQGNIPNDYSGFELGARMNEIGNINTSLKKLIDKDLYSNIKKFKNDLAPVNNSNINTSFQTIINYIENEGQAILTQLDNLYNFYLQGLNFAAAASQKKLYYQSSDQKYYIIKDLLDDTQRDEIKKVEGLSSQHEEPLFGILDDNNWNNINDGSLGTLLLKIANNLNEINNEVKTYAANYLGVFNNWQKKIQDILDKIKINTLNLQKISAGRFYPMYSLGEDIDTEVDGGPSKNYYSRDLFEAESDNTFDKGLLNRITTPTSESGLCGFDSQIYSDTISTDDDNKYQIYWYYERNGYTPGEGENPYGGPGWCEIEDNGSVNDVGRFTILNPSVKNIGLPQPTGDGYPTKPDENDQNGYLSISFSSNRPDIKEEKIKCVIIYNHKKYESNILTFKNEDPAAGPELTNAIQLIHGKNSRDIYTCYNADNTLTNASDKVTPRELKIQYLNERGEPETGEDSTLIGSTVYWYVPTGVTMLTVNSKDAGIDNENNIGDFECGSATERTYNITNELKLQYETNRVLLTDAKYIYHGDVYQFDTQRPKNCINVQSYDHNKTVNLTFQYSIEDLVYGGITYKFSDDSKQIVSSNGKKYVIRNNQVTLPVDDPDQYDKEGFAYYYKTINSIDDLTFKYRIKEHYSQSFVNNTILCKVIKNNRILEDSKTFTFSSQGVNGTNYSLVIDAEDGAHIFWNDDYKFSLSLFDYDGNQIPFMNPPTITCTNQSSIALSPKSSNENGVLSYRCTIHARDQGSGVMTVKVTQPWPIDSDNVVNLEKIQPIAYTASLSYIAEVPTEIIYDSSGSNPTYYKEPLSLYEKMPNGDLKLVEGGGWKIDIEVEDESEKKYFPVLQGQKLEQDNEIKYKNGLTTLKPLNMYITNNNKSCFLVYRSNNNSVIWEQPIIITQNRFPSTLLNNWDESLQINTEDGTILSNLVGAGRKNGDNSFSGILMGDVGGKVDDIDSRRGFGLYGFHEGAQSFGFNVDGTAFLGKSNGGRIIFDGNSGQIKSRNYEQNKSGMTIDLDDGHIDAYNFKLSSGKIQLNSSPSENQNYFLIGKDDKNSPCLKYDYKGNLTLRVNELEITGTTENPNLLNNSGPQFYQTQGDSGPDYVTQNWFIAENSENPTYDRGTGSIYIERDTSLQQSITCGASSYTLSGKILCGSKVTIEVYLSDSNQAITRDYNSPNQWYNFTIQLENRKPITNIKIRPTQTVWVKELKLEIGLNESPVWTASQADNEQQKADQYINQEYVFNKLTHNGRNQGIYLGDYDNDGNRELFINADYIKAGEINADLIKTGTINADLIKAGTINANDVTIINLKANNITGALSSTVTIGGWHISNSSIESYTNNSNQTTTYHMRLFSTDQNQNNSIAINSPPKTDWRIVAGSKFGVDKNGVLYATDVHLSGIVNAQNGGSIGTWQIKNGNLSDENNNTVLSSNGTFTFQTASGNYVGLQAWGSTNQCALAVNADIHITEGHHIYVGNKQIA